MKIEMKYTSGILNLPLGICDLVPSASEEQLKVLLSLAGAPQHLNDFEPYLTTLSQRLNLDANEIKKAIAFWSEKGIITVEGLEIAIENAAKEDDATNNRVPAYTGKQIISYVENNKTFHALCNECQSVMGKNFTAHDYNSIMQLKSYYKFSDEFILLLLAH